MRLRFFAGTALASALLAWLGHGFAADARRKAESSALQRTAVVELQAATALIARAGGEARRAVLAWQAQTPDVAQVRLARGMQLEISTAPGDAAPRRLSRDEKPLYDRGQRIFSAVSTNRDEGGGQKAELEIEPLAGGRLSLAGPLEQDGAPVGTVELVTAPLPPPPAAGWGAFLLWLAAPALAFGVLAIFIGERRWLLALAASLSLAAALGLLLRTSAALVEADVRQGAAAVAARVQEQAALVESLAPGAALSPAGWDADAFRKPRGELTEAGAVDPARLSATVAAALHDVRRGLFAAFALALGLLFLTGFGAFHSLGRTIRHNRQAYAYIAPAIVGMLVLVFYPFSYGITLSFTDSNLYNTNKSLPEIWVGLRNYADILGDFSFVKQAGTGLSLNYGSFYWTLLFTILWTVCNVTIGISVGLLLALILNTRDLALRPVYRVLLILPWAMPNYITSLIWKGMFHQQFGVINQLFQLAGLPAVNWFERPVTSFLTALATNGWLSFPFMMVVSLGALQSIPADLYEAARVDGASRWQQFKAITLPSLRPALVPAVILSVVWTFNMFNIIYLVTGGEPGGATEILVTQAYKFAFERYRYGYAAAYSTVIFGILLVYGVVQNRVSKATEA